MGHGGPDQVGHAEDVDFHLAAGLRVGVELKGAGNAEAGAVDQNIHAALGGGDLVHRLFDALFVRDVGPDVHDVGEVRPLFPPAHFEDQTAGGGKSPHYLQADAGAAAADQSDQGITHRTSPRRG